MKGDENRTTGSLSDCEKNTPIHQIREKCRDNYRAGERRIPLDYGYYDDYARHTDVEALEPVSSGKCRDNPNPTSQDWGSHGLPVPQSPCHDSDILPEPPRRSEDDRLFPHFDPKQHTIKESELENLPSNTAITPVFNDPFEEADRRTRERRINTAAHQGEPVQYLSRYDFAGRKLEDGVDGAGKEYFIVYRSIADLFDQFQIGHIYARYPQHLSYGPVGFSCNSEVWASETELRDYVEGVAEKLNTTASVLMRILYSECERITGKVIAKKEACADEPEAEPIFHVSHPDLQAYSWYGEQHLPNGNFFRIYSTLEKPDEINLVYVLAENFRSLFCGYFLCGETYTKDSRKIYTASLLSKVPEEEILDLIQRECRYRARVKQSQEAVHKANALDAAAHQPQLADVITGEAAESLAKHLNNQMREISDVQQRNNLRTSDYKFEMKNYSPLGTLAKEESVFERGSVLWKCFACNKLHNTFPAENGNERTYTCPYTGSQQVYSQDADGKITPVKVLLKTYIGKCGGTIEDGVCEKCGEVGDDHIAVTIGTLGEANKNTGAKPDAVFFDEYSDYSEEKLLKYAEDCGKTPADAPELLGFSHVCPPYAHVCTAEAETEAGDFFAVKEKSSKRKHRDFSWWPFLALFLLILIVVLIALTYGEYAPQTLP